MSALPRCAPPLGSVQEIQPAVLQQLQHLQGTGVHVHQPSAEPAVPARMTLDSLAARHQQLGGRLHDTQQSGVNVHQTAIALTVPALTRPPLDALAAEQCHSTALTSFSTAQHYQHLTQPQLPVSASLNTAAVPPLNSTAAAPTYQATLRRFTLDIEKEAQLSKHVHPAARGAAEAVVKTILHEEGPMALRPSSFHQLMQAANLIQNLNAQAMADSTSAQDRGSNWNWWSAWCATWNTPPVRVYIHSRATTAEQQREGFLWTASIPWILVRMKPGSGRAHPLPSSAVAVLRGVSRVLRLQLKFEPPPSRLLNDTLKGLMRVYMDEHGPEALEPHRTEPIPHSVICSVMGLLRQTATHHDAEGKEILRVVADDLHHFSLRALVATHMQTGLRKAETTSKTKKMTLKDMTRSNVTWKIDGIYVTAPTKRQLQSMVSGRDFAMLKPPPSKSDQWGAVWGSLHIYLTYLPELECNAAAALAELEIFHPVQLAADRRKTPLFMDNQARPITGSEADKWILKALSAVKCAAKYSWHSFRVALACSLLASNASHSEIQALCRWQSEASLRIYARMSQPHYHSLLRAAYGADISQIQPHSLPCTSDLGIAQELSRFTIPVTVDPSHLVGDLDE